MTAFIKNVLFIIFVLFCTYQYGKYDGIQEQSHKGSQRETQ